MNCPACWEEQCDCELEEILPKGVVRVGPKTLATTDEYWEEWAKELLSRLGDKDEPST